MDTNAGSNKKGLITKIAVGAIIVAIYFGFVIYKDRTGAKDAAEMSGNATETESGTKSEETASPYKDGTYSATGQYTSPGGPEEIGVELTLANGIIESIEVEPKATLPISVRMQSDFAANYKMFVVGKPIEGLALTKVSGSSLTPKGFNDALLKIRAQASAQATS